MHKITTKIFVGFGEKFYILSFGSLCSMFCEMFSAPQQVLRNRRRMSALTTLQQRVAANSARTDKFNAVKKQTQTLREFFEDLQVEENRLKREILKIAQKIKNLEKTAVEDVEASNCAWK